MRIVGVYSFNNGEAEVTKRYPHLLVEVNDAVKSVDSAVHKTKVSKEKTMPGRLIFSPPALNTAFKHSLIDQYGWKPVRVPCQYPTQFYRDGYTPPKKGRGEFREMDFVKEKLGVEVQFGKYSFMVYNVAAKMTIFRNLGFIDCGIEIVPVLTHLAHSIATPPPTGG